MYIVYACCTSVSVFWNVYAMEFIHTFLRGSKCTATVFIRDDRVMSDVDSSYTHGHRHIDIDARTHIKQTGELNEYYISIYRRRCFMRFTVFICLQISFYLFQLCVVQLRLLICGWYVCSSYLCLNFLDKSPAWYELIFDLSWRTSGNCFHTYIK